MTQFVDGVADRGDLIARFDRLAVVVRFFEGPVSDLDGEHAT